MYDYLFQRNFPLYMALFGPVRLLNFRNFYEFTTSVHFTEKIPCPNPYPSEKYTDIRSMKQKQTKALCHLEFVNFRSPSGDLGTRLGTCSESSILLLTSGDTSGDVSTLLLSRSILLLTSWYFSTLYYYFALYDYSEGKSTQIYSLVY